MSEQPEFSAGRLRCAHGETAEVGVSHDGRGGFYPHDISFSCGCNPWEVKVIDQQWVALPRRAPGYPGDLYLAGRYYSIHEHGGRLVTRHTADSDD